VLQRRVSLGNRVCLLALTFIVVLRRSILVVIFADEVISSFRYVNVLDDADRASPGEFDTASQAEQHRVHAITRCAFAALAD
jgi:hypothetical protein